MIGLVALQYVLSLFILSVGVVTSRQSFVFVCCHMSITLAWNIYLAFNNTRATLFFAYMCPGWAMFTSEKFSRCWCSKFLEKRTGLAPNFICVLI